jgi:hypothetical protein
MQKKLPRLADAHRGPKKIKSHSDEIKAPEKAKYVHLRESNVTGICPYHSVIPPLLPQSQQNWFSGSFKRASSRLRSFT